MEQNVIFARNHFRIHHRAGSYGAHVTVHHVRVHRHRRRDVGGGGPSGGCYRGWVERLLGAV